MGTVTKSVTLIPSGNTGVSNLTVPTSGSYTITNAYKASGNTSNYCRITVNTSTTGYFYLTFDTSEIPSGATVTGISGTVTVRVSNTGRVTNTVCQLYTGTTAKGNNVTFASTSTSNTVTLSPGNSWTRSELNDFRLRIGATGSSATQTKYIYLYGASITVNYTVTTYDITVQNSTSATVTATPASVEAGEDAEIIASTLSGIRITDNGTDVTNQFVQGLQGSVSAVPGSYDTGGSINGTNYQSTIGKGSDTANRSGNDYFSTTQGGSGSTWIDYFFDFSEIPTGATILTNTLTVKGHCESTSESREISKVQAYAGTTAKGTATDMTESTSDRVYTISIGTWTATELHSAKIRHTIGVYGGLVSGATWTVTYEISGYVYTISSVAANHTIVVTASGVTDTIYFKNNGAWVAATKVYKKVNGTWVQQTNLTNVFDQQTNYVKGN